MGRTDGQADGARTGGVVKDRKERVGDADEEESLMRDSGRAPGASASSQSGLRIDVDNGGRPPLPSGVHHRSASSGQWSADNLRSMMTRRSSSTVLQSTLRGGEALGALPLPMDFVQPELVAPAHIPIPHAPPPAVESTASVGQTPSLLDEELSWEALERRSAAAGVAGRGKSAGGGGGQQKEEAKMEDRSSREEL